MFDWDHDGDVDFVDHAMGAAVLEEIEEEEKQRKAEQTEYSGVSNSSVSMSPEDKKKENDDVACGVIAFVVAVLIVSAFCTITGWGVGLGNGLLLSGIAVLILYAVLYCVLSSFNEKMTRK